VSETPLLRVEGVSRRYGRTVALDGASLAAHGGEVVALLGLNGAGKSTLTRILSGAEAPDSGAMWIDGESYAPRSVSQAGELGVVAVQQQRTVLPGMTVAENLCLNEEPSTWNFLLDGRAMRRQAEEALELMGIDARPNDRVSDLGPAEQQLLDIARALRRRARVLILDEPTAALGADEAKVVYGGVGRARATGAACIFISHNLDEIYAVSSEAVVLRDGRSYGPLALDRTDRRTVIETMTGEQQASEGDAGPPSRAVGDRDVVLSVARSPTEADPRPIALEVRAGEVLGLTGPAGSGRAEMIESLAGVRRGAGMELWRRATRLRLRDPAHGMRHGIYQVPDARMLKGLAGGLSIRHNVSLPWIAHAARAGIVRRRAERRGVQEICERLQVRRRDNEQAVGALSGGNQQKVLIGKWVSAAEQGGRELAGSVFLFSEPTEGVDVRTRPQIWAELRRLARAGVGVVISSSDAEELLAVCDSIVVFDHGVWHAAIRGSDVTAQRLVGAVMGDQQLAEERQ